jgi:hypothetical protein
MLFNMRPIKNALNELAQASVIFPSILQRVNEDKLAEAILDSTDFPQDLMRTDEEVAAMREQQQAMMEQQMAQEQLGQMAESYPKVTGAPEEGSPAAALGEAIGA